MTSMRHKRKLIPIKPLGCVTRYDLNLIAEADAELDRAGGCEPASGGGGGLPFSQCRQRHRL